MLHICVQRFDGMDEKILGEELQRAYSAALVARHMLSGPSTHGHILTFPSLKIRFVPKPIRNMEPPGSQMILDLLRPRSCLVPPNFF